MLTKKSDRNSLSDGVSMGERGLVCQGKGVTTYGDSISVGRAGAYHGMSRLGRRGLVAAEIAGRSVHIGLCIFSYHRLQRIEYVLP